jgi:DNA-binding Lrp family transcriptional regulator
MTVLDEPEDAALRKRVFKYLADHPDGTRFKDIQQELGLSREEVSRVVKELMGDGKVVQRGFMYHAI